MSRYSLRPHRYLPQLFEVAIGWDPSFATYFACAYGQPDDNGDPVIIRHIGLGWRDVEHPEAVIAFARPLARIPSDIFRRLTLDARRCPPRKRPQQPRSPRSRQTANSTPKRTFPMQIGTIRLGRDNRLSGQIDYHGRNLRIVMKPLANPSGPTHELLLDGLSTKPPSFAYAGKEPRNHTARLTLAPDTTLYLGFKPTSDGGFRIEWSRPRATNPVTAKRLTTS